MVLLVFDNNLYEREAFLCKFVDALNYLNSVAHFSYNESSNSNNSYFNNQDLAIQIYSVDPIIHLDTLPHAMHTAILPSYYYFPLLLLDDLLESNCKYKL